MKKSIMRSGIMTAFALALALSLTLTGCGGKSEPEPETTGITSEEAVGALDGTWADEEGYALILDGAGGRYKLKVPGGRIGEGEYFTSGAPDEYTLNFNGLTHSLVLVEDGSLSVIQTEPTDIEELETLGDRIFTRDDSAYFDFDLASLNGSWRADGAALTLDTDAREYQYSSGKTSAMGDIDNDEDGRGWYIGWLVYDEEFADNIDVPVFLVPDSDGKLRLERDDPEFTGRVFVQESSEADIPAAISTAYSSASSLKSDLDSIGAWTDDAGHKLGFKVDNDRYILQTAGGRNGGGKLRVNPESGAYEISFNGADYALSLAEDDFDVLCLTMVGGTPACNGESLDGVRLTNDMFEMVYENPASFLHGSWADDAGFKLNFDSLYEEDTPRFDYVSPNGSGDGILSNDEDGMGWYIPWKKDSDGKAYVILEGYSGSPEGHYMTFETDDPALAAVKLKEIED